MNKKFLLSISLKEILISLLILTFLTSLLFVSNTKSNNKPQPSDIQTISTKPSLTPTATIAPSPTIILATPTPTTPVYRYILWKSNDEIHLTVPTNTGYAIYALLKDEKFNIVTNQSGFVYKWTIDDKSLVKDGASSFDGCTNGIQPPCPQDHYTFAANKAGKTVIRVEVTKGTEVVAATTFPLIIEENK